MATKEEQENIQNITRILEIQQYEPQQSHMGIYWETIYLIVTVTIHKILY